MKRILILLLCFSLLCFFIFYLNATWLIFLLLVPLQLISASKQKGKWFFIWVGLLLWGGFVNNWLFQAYPPVFIHLLISFSLFIIPFYFQNKLKNHLVANIVFIISWMILEYMHVSTFWGNPFIPLGNHLGRYPSLIQWYQVTGLLGGSVWVLLVNILVFKFIHTIKKKKGKNYKGIVVILTALFLPIVISALIPPSKAIKTGIKKVYLVSDVPAHKPALYKKLYKEHIQKAQKKKCNWIVFPENGDMVLSIKQDTKEFSFKDSIKTWLKGSDLEVVMGGATMEAFTNGQALQSTNYTQIGDVQWCVKNVAMSIKRNGEQIRSKQRMVPVKEYLNPTGFEKKILSSFITETQSLLHLEKEKPKIFCSEHGCESSLICYEAFFGEFVRQFSEKGSEVFFLHQNENWTGSSAANNQILNLA